MSVKHGKTTLQDLKLHVKITWSGTPQTLRQAKGEAPLPSGRYASGSEKTVKAAERGREQAIRFLQEIAQRGVAYARAQYAQLGFDLPVEARRRGNSWRVEVTGGEDAQKWARILEGGSKGVDPHDFIMQSKRKRAVVVTRMNQHGPPSKQNGSLKRGGKESQPGWYIVVPIIHGKVTRGENGKLEFKPRRDVNIRHEEQLEQFTATPTGFDTVSAGDDATYNTGEFTETRRVNKDGSIRMGRRHHQAEGNPEWERMRVRQAIRKPGIFYTERDGEPREGVDDKYLRGNNLDPEKNMANARQQRANRKGARIMRELGVDNLRVMSPEASLDTGSDTQRQVVERRRGDVLSFAVMSTRRPLRKRMGERKAYHVMRNTAQEMRAAIEQEIRDVEARMKDGGTFKERAYLEVLRQAR